MSLASPMTCRAPAGAHGRLAAVTAALEAVRSDPVVLSDASRAASDAHSPTTEALPHDEVRRHVDVLLDALVARVNGAEPGPTAAAADDLARDRAAQGVSLASLLSGFQAARSRLVASLLRHLRDTLTPDELPTLLTLLDGAVGTLQTDMILAHQAAEKALGRMRSALQLDALRALLDQGDPAAVGDLGLDPDRRYHCVVAAVSAPREARELQGRLTGSDGVAGLVQGYLCTVTAQPPRDADRFPGVLVMGSPPVDVADLPAAHTACRQAIDIARARGDVGLRSMIDYAVDVAVDGRLPLGRIVADALLGDLDPADAFHRQLVETGRAYLGHGRRIDATAQVMHLHPNTVTHRLRRLGDMTGFAAVEQGPDAFACTARWWWAFRTWLADPA